MVSLRGKCQFQNPHDRGALLRGDLIESNALVAEKKLRVGPSAPFGRVNVVARLLTLLFIQKLDKLVRGMDDIIDWNAVVL